MKHPQWNYNFSFSFSFSFFFYFLLLLLPPPLPPSHSHSFFSLLLSYIYLIFWNTDMRVETRLSFSLLYLRVWHHRIQSKELCKYFIKNELISNIYTTLLFQRWTNLKFEISQTWEINDMIYLLFWLNKINLVLFKLSEIL